MDRMMDLKETLERPDDEVNDGPSHPRTVAPKVSPYVLSKVHPKVFAKVSP